MEYQPERLLSLFYDSLSAVSRLIFMFLLNTNFLNA